MYAFLGLGLGALGPVEMKGFRALGFVVLGCLSFHVLKFGALRRYRV